MSTFTISQTKTAAECQKSCIKKRKQPAVTSSLFIEVCRSMQNIEYEYKAL